MPQRGSLPHVLAAHETPLAVSEPTSFGRRLAMRGKGFEPRKDGRAHGVRPLRLSWPKSLRASCRAAVNGASAMRGKGFEPLDHRETLPARFARRTATPVVSFAPAGRSRDLYRSGFRVRRGRIAVCFITHGIYAREERPREGVFRTAEQCEGRDLNPWTSTGADLESAAVSRLGYPRTRARIPHRP